MGVFDKLNNQISKRPSSPKIGQKKDGFIHPNSEQMITSACNLIARTDTGQMLLDFAKKADIKIHAVTNSAEHTQSTDPKTIYIGVPAAQETGSARIVILLSGALREAMQEEIDELKRPPLSWPEHDYAQRMVEKDRDKWWYSCAVAHDLIENHGLRELFDELHIMGYYSLLEAYGKDLQEADDTSVDE